MGGACAVIRAGTSCVCVNPACCSPKPPCLTCPAALRCGLLQNLSEEVDVEMLFDFFSQFGEIYQCKTDSDLYDQYFGQVGQQVTCRRCLMCSHSS
jgi:hypothetical protein